MNLGLRQSDLGRLSGIGRPTLTSWENGGMDNMRISSLNKLSRALNTTPDVILGYRCPESGYDLSRLNGRVRPESREEL